MTFETLVVEIDERVAVVTVNRPEKRNALNSLVRRELLDALDRLETDDGVRVVVFTGAGDRSFIAGADIAEFAERSAEEQRRVMDGPSVFERIAAYPKPTIAMINGAALGGGCELALACDIRIAARGARIGQPEVNLGLIPGGGGTQRLPRLVGSGNAMRLVLGGELIDAEEALRIGLVQQIVEPASLRAETLRVAKQIASKSPVAVRLAKQAVRGSADRPLSEGLAHERELFLTAFASEDAKEGLTAFLEKRPPGFRGR
jgi:enoyl-CoA hydratase